MSAVRTVPDAAAARRFLSREVSRMSQEVWKYWVGEGSLDAASVAG